jgi:hypothetical protein
LYAAVPRYSLPCLAMTCAALCFTDCTDVPQNCSAAPPAVSPPPSCPAGPARPAGAHMDQHERGRVPAQAGAGGCLTGGVSGCWVVLVVSVDGC